MVCSFSLLKNDIMGCCLSAACVGEGQQRAGPHDNRPHIPLIGDYGMLPNPPSSPPPPPTSPLPPICTHEHCVHSERGGGEERESLCDR